MSGMMVFAVGCPITGLDITAFLVLHHQLKLITKTNSHHSATAPIPTALSSHELPPRHQHQLYFLSVGTLCHWHHNMVNSHANNLQTVWLVMAGQVVEPGEGVRKNKG